MALLQNGFRDFSSGVRIFGATARNSGYPYVAMGNTNRTSTKRNLTSGEGITTQLAGVPDGYRNQYTWIMPQQAGALRSRNEIQAVATLAAAGAMGKNGEATITAEGLLEAVGQLVVSAVATISGQATISANILAALAAAANLAGTGSVTAAIDALAWAVSALQGTASTTFTPYATGELEATIDVAATQDLTAGSIADEILDQNMVETGLTVRETLRLCAAALAGKVSISGSTVTIRNAVADDADRIVATTTTDGERTAITYDLG